LAGFSVVSGGGAVPLCGFPVLSGVALQGSNLMPCGRPLVSVGRFVVSSGRGAVRRLGARMGLLCALGRARRITFGWRFAAFEGALAATQLGRPGCGTLTCWCGHAAPH
jgi:hypothetical protein